jgi:hypothetical protein
MWRLLATGAVIRIILAIEGWRGPTTPTSAPSPFSSLPHVQPTESRFAVLESFPLGLCRCTVAIASAATPV